MEKNLLVDMGVQLPEGTDWDDVAQAITQSIITIVERLNGECGGSVRFQAFNYDDIVAELALETQAATGSESEKQSTLESIPTPRPEETISRG